MTSAMRSGWHRRARRIRDPGSCVENPLRKSSTAARFYSLGQLPERADDVKSVVSQKQPNVAKHDLLGRASSPGSPPTLTFCRASISGPQPLAVSQHQNRIPVRSRTRASIGPSGSPRSPAEPHPPSLAWVETPLPLGPLPLPPGPLNAKHSKRAQGAVFNGTHSPVRSEPSSPTPGSSLCAGGSRTWRGPPVRSRRLTTKSEPVGLCTELCPSPNLRPTSDRRPRSALQAATDHSLPYPHFFLPSEYVLDYGRREGAHAQACQAYAGQQRYRNEVPGIAPRWERSTRFLPWHSSRGYKPRTAS